MCSRKLSDGNRDRAKRPRPRSRRISIESLERRHMLSAAGDGNLWHNYGLPADVNDDGSVTPGDLLTILDDIRRNGIRQLPVNPDQLPAGFLDVDDNGAILPADALIVLDRLNRAADGTMSAATQTPRLLVDWNFDQSDAPYFDRSGNAIPLHRDHNTGAPQAAIGVDGAAAELQWQNPVSTRLMSYDPALQTDSFGFSFWLDPVNLSAYENFIGKEMAATNAGPDYSRLAWQVHLAGDDGTGSAPIEFVVRGGDRSLSNFFGNVFSTIKLPLHRDRGRWYHIAGGYDAENGQLSLYVNGVEALAAGRAGAHNSDGGAFVVGSMVNGSTFVAYSALAAIDEVQLYDGPLTAADVAVLKADPGRTASQLAPPSLPAQLIAHWKLNEPGPWYGDWSGNQNNLNLDSVTAAPPQPMGVEGGAAGIHWQADPGITTRLYASGDALQTDNIGFSFWISPTRLAPGENFIAKEMPVTGGEAFTRLAWQVAVGPDSGAGLAPLELIVRGNDRGQGDFFGNVRSLATLPLYTESQEWIHVAGGYDSTTGALSLFVDGVPFYTVGRAGAKSSDGSWFDVGSVRNGLDFVAYGAVAEIDDVQLYNRPLSAYDVAVLRHTPSRQVNPLTQLNNVATTTDANGDLSVTFNSVVGWFYRLEASAAQAAYLPLGIVTGRGATTTATFSKADLDRILGPAARPNLLVRVSPLLEDPVDGSLDLPPAGLTPSVNSEEYVPQYHYSLPNANMGDPTGLIRFQNQYHVFTWDHATSSDMVTWAGQGWPMRDTIDDSGYWTGSVVVDKQNTSGSGTLANPPMVAIYTIHNNTTGKETIGISYSTNYRDFYQYSGNPVVTTGDTVFRDPDVFWDTQTNRWIMLVARSEARSIQFYASTDLKSWQLLSEFGPVGARAEIWEVPSLVQVPIAGMEGHSRWLLSVGAGSNKVQYFVGNFDGTRFTMDDATRDYLEKGTGLDGELFADFEKDNYWDAGWTYTGEAFGNEPAPDWWNGPARGYLGQRLASSYVRGDWLTDSTLTSRDFTIAKDAINFLIAGGNHPGQTCVNLLVDGQVVRSTTGDNSDQLRWAGWDVTEFKGRQARIQIVDNFGGFWGRIYVDQIMFSDVVTDTHREHANWVDFGSDFFAPKVLRDYDGVQQGATWMGWIGNWQYEASRPEPANWGKGVESVFRDLHLQASPRGYQLLQTPAQSLQKLRGPEIDALPQTILDTRKLVEFRPNANTYEIEATFNLKDAGSKFGLNLTVNNAPQRVVVGFDKTTSNLYLDRTSSGYVTFGSGFQNVVTSPYQPTDDQLTLHILVDQSSIEVFVDGGQRVFTSQIYPDPSGTGIELFSEGGPTTLQNLKAWQLDSIWK